MFSWLNKALSQTIILSNFICFFTLLKIEAADCFIRFITITSSHKQWYSTITTKISNPIHIVLNLADGKVCLLYGKLMRNTFLGVRVSLSNLWQQWDNRLVICLCGSLFWSFYGVSKAMVSLLIKVMRKWEGWRRR